MMVFRTLALSVTIMILIITSMQQAPTTSGQADHDVLNFVPLGRFEIDLTGTTSDPSGIYIAGTQIEVEILDGDTGEDDTSESDGAAPETIEIYNYFLAVADIRGGELLWRVPIGDRAPDRIRYSPDGSIILVEVSSDETPEEIFLTFHDASDGSIISATSNIDLIRTPIIPGDVNQTLYTSIAFSSDNAHVIVDYYRRAESPHCAVWRIADASLVWEIPTSCGYSNFDGTALAFMIENDNSFTDYPQLEVYNVATGAVLNRSNNEVLDFSWLNNKHVLIQRPYGEPPVIWHVEHDTFAALEMPYLTGNMWPRQFDDQLIYTDDYATYFWDINTGRIRLSVDVPARGIVITRPDGVMLTFLSSSRYDEDTEAYVDTFSAHDIETGDLLWQRDWSQTEVTYSETRFEAAAYNYDTGYYDFIDLYTGETIGSLRTFTDFPFLLDDWSYILEGTRDGIVIWGPPEQRDEFPNPPHAQIADETPLYLEPNTNFDPQGTLPAGQLLWLEAQTDGGAWYAYRTVYGSRYWIAAENISLLADAAEIPTIQP